MIMVILKAFGIWCLLVLCAILNGLLREKILNPMLGQGIALPVSGLLLSLLIFIVAWILVPFIVIKQPIQFWLIGGLWLAFTLAFEFLFGHYVAGKSWQDILQVFNLYSGNLFLLVLMVTLIAPWLVAKIRGLI